jgi:hypothetical protein
MRHLAILWCVICLLVSVVNGADTTAPNARAKYNFNHGWKVFVGDPAGAKEATFDDSSWKKSARTLRRQWASPSRFV